MQPPSAAISSSCAAAVPEDWPSHPRSVGGLEKGKLPSLNRPM